MPPRKKNTKTTKKSTPKLGAQSEKQSELPEERTVENQTINPATVIAAHPPVVEPESAATAEGFDAKLRKSKQRKTSADKHAEEQLDTTGAQHAVTGALKKLVDRGYAVPPPGAALYRGGTSNNASIQNDTAASTEVTTPINTVPQVNISLRTDADPLNAADINSGDHRNILAGPQTPVRATGAFIGTPQVNRKKHDERTVEFELAAGKDAMADVLSAKMPIYLVSAGNEKPTYQIPTRKSLKILSDYNTPLKDRHGDIWRLEQGRRIRLGQAQKILGDEEVKGLELSNIGWMPLEEKGNKLVVKLEWGQSDAYKSDARTLHAHPSGSAPAQAQATQEALKYIEVSSDQSEPETEAAALTKFLREILEIPAVDLVSKSEVTAGQLFYRWKVLRDARNKMKSLGWLKRGGKNIYLVGAKKARFYGMQIGQQELGDLVGVRKSTVSNDESLFKKAIQVAQLWVDELKSELKPEYEGMAPAIFKETVESALEKLKAGDGKVRQHSKKKSRKHKHSKRHSSEEDQSGSNSSISDSSSESESDNNKHKRRKHK